MVQKGTVEDYQEKFEELRAYMLQYNPHLEKGYFMSSFLSGLKEELKPRVLASEPPSIAFVFRLAKLHEMSIELENKSDRLSRPKKKKKFTLKIWG